MWKNTWLSFLGKADEFIKLLTSVYPLQTFEKDQVNLRAVLL